MTVAALAALLTAGCQALSGVLTGSWRDQWPTLSSVCKAPECERSETGSFAFRRKDGATQAILFVHGFRSSADTAFSLWPEQVFHDQEFQDFDVWAFNYPSGLQCPKSSQSLNDVASELADFILTRLRDRRGRSYDEFHIIAHSLGGVVARRAILSLLRESKARQFGLQTLHLADSPNEGIHLTTLVGNILKCQVPQVEMTTGAEFLRDLRAGWTMHVFRQRRDLSADQQKDIETYVYVPQRENFVSRESALASFDEVVEVPGILDHWSLVKIDQQRGRTIYDDVKGKILWHRGYERPTKPTVWIANLGHDRDEAATAGLVRDIEEAVSAASVAGELEVRRIKRELTGERWETQQVKASRIARWFRPALVVWGERQEATSGLKLVLNMLVEPATAPGWRPDFVLTAPYRVRAPVVPQWSVAPRALSVKTAVEVPADVVTLARLVVSTAMTQVGRYRAAHRVLETMRLPSELTELDRLRINILRAASAVDAARLWEPGGTPCAQPYLRVAREITSRTLEEPRSGHNEVDISRALVWLRFYGAFADWLVPAEQQSRPRSLEELRVLHRDFARLRDEVGQGMSALLIGSSLPWKRIEEPRRWWDLASTTLRDPTVQWFIAVNVNTALVDSSDTRSQEAALEELRRLAKQRVDAGDADAGAFALYNLAVREYQRKRYNVALATLETQPTLQTVLERPTSSLAAAYLLLASHLALMLDQRSDEVGEWLSVARTGICQSEEPNRSATADALAALAQVRGVTSTAARAAILRRALNAWRVSTTILTDLDDGRVQLTLSLLREVRATLAARSSDDCALEVLRANALDLAERTGRHPAATAWRAQFTEVHRDIQSARIGSCSEN